MHRLVRGRLVHVMIRTGPNTIPRLSERQEQCLRRVLEFKSAKEIARDLGISQHAVEKHLRVVREKFSVDSTADAARIFAAMEERKDFPPYGSSDLPPELHVRHPAAVPDHARGWVGDATGALSLNEQLTPRQTLLAILAVSFLSIVGLLLLVACAEGVKALVR